MRSQTPHVCYLCPMKTILAPVDFSGVTDAVVSEAAALARALHARVVLFAAVQPPVVLAEYAPIIENIAEINAAGEKHAMRELARLEEKLQAELVSCESSHALGSPISLIVDHAEKCAADYIVMGSHGHTALYDLLVGSTTHGVLMRAKCPVVIVPAVKDAKSKSARRARPAALV
jgi:nucleotide-binding universal stress UspA family protein